MEKINLNLLPIEIDDYIEFDENYYKNTDIKHMDKFHIKGKIFYNLSEEIEIDLNVEGNIYLDDAITLEEIKYPINIKCPNPRLAKYIISQYGGPDGELGASLRYLSQRFAMPDQKAKATLNDIGTEELAPFCYQL